MMHFIRFNCLVVLLLVLSVDARHRARRGARSGSGSGGRSSRSSEEYRQRDPRDKPNFVLFFADDMGYGDLASYGHPTQERGPIDDIMVEGGIRFTQGYVPDTVCTPSRTALLTGRYPVRSGVFSSPGGTRVFQPSARVGLPSSEITLAEALKTKGYSTGMMGKWHLGEYGDNINEMSWAVGEVINALQAQGLSQNTLVLFISDHGPQPEYCAQGGDASIFKGYKTNTWEGGVRVPFVAYWPGQITPRESDEIVSTLDIMQTFVDLANGTLPNDRPYDGKVITDVLLNNAPSPHDVLYYYCKDRLMAVRSGPYKVHYYTHRVRSDDYFAGQCKAGGQPSGHYFDCYHCYDSCVTQQDPPLMYNVENDPAEKYALDTTTDPVLAAFMADLQAKVTAHNLALIPAEPLLDDEDPTKSVTPCCNPDTNCICNYGPVTGPYN